MNNECFIFNERLDTHLRNRPSELEEAKRNGVKIVGFFPGNYVPEELIYASGAVPLCLIHGGNPKPAETALSSVPRVICPFARALIGEMMLKENPFYSAVDMVVAPITCQHLRKTAEIWEYRGEPEVFKLGIPHQVYDGLEVNDFAERLDALKDKLQALTGNKVTDAKLTDAVKLYNRMRQLLRKISLMRTSNTSVISSMDFIKLNHVSFYADPVFMTEVLEEIYGELAESNTASDNDAPRLLLAGPNIAMGDYRVPELVEAAGGNIVIEEICEGVRYYWNEIEAGDDLMKSLAKGYLTDRVPCAFMSSSAGKRLEFMTKLISDFHVSGVIWYELLDCEVYDSEAYFFTQKLSEQNIPMLILEADYGTADIGQFKTRIEAFIEMVKEEVE
ncbi:MAG: 2-hydroxyacyl-CoA dehydratase [Spirochaetes bacterium]|nr:2-hydroxyacyl-CoA dehydratase [Spirochaetota bacterium]